MLAVFMQTEHTQR